eukprot:898718-Prymnesium_polylepis.1
MRWRWKLRNVRARRPPAGVCVCYGPTGRGTRTGHACVCVTGRRVCVNGLRGRGTREHANMARVRDTRTTRAGSHAEVEHQACVSDVELAHVRK